MAALVLAVAAVATQLANLQHHATPLNGYYEAKLEGNLLKIIDPRTGKVIVIRIRFVNSSAVRAVPEAAPSNGVERYEIKPAIIRVTVPISGTLPPSSGDAYGPYSGAMDLQIQLSWSPASYVCAGYIYASTGSGPATCTYGTSVSADFPVNPSETIYALVGNGGPNTITYSGTLTLYYNITN